MSKLPSNEQAPASWTQTLEVVEDDLNVALAFVQISSAAYSMGNLQHACDAHSKAKAAHARAVARLTESHAANRPRAVQSKLNEVRSALSSLPSSASQALWMRRAAG